MNKIDTSDWKEFKASDLFEISGTMTTSLYDLETTYGKGEHPYITTRATNNGIAGFYDKKTETGNVLVADSAVVGFISYQEEDFSASDHVELLKPKFLMDKYIALFLKTIFMKGSYKYEYGRKFNQDRIKDTVLLLPKDKTGNPDWGKIRDYIKNIEKEIIFRPIKTKTESIQSEIDRAHWKEYKISDLFNHKKGKTLSAENKEIYKGDIPCINGSAYNNGILTHLDNSIENLGFVLQKAPCLSISRVGSSGLTFLQEEDFYIADNAYSLTLKDKFFGNKYIYLFLRSILNKELYKYSYGRIINSKYFDTKIILPTKDNEPDWQTMENYIKSLPYADLI